jgi:ribonuclease BN (tRNA processing enzyme)
MRITLWGTRGAITTPGPGKIGHGANTACVTITEGDRMLILDAGIGIIPLSERLMATKKPKDKLDLHLLLSHLHWDHVIGLPFFIPVFLPSTTLEILGRNADEIEAATERLFTSTYSPIKGTKNLGATLVYRALGQPRADIDGFAVTHAALQHPNGALAYRVEAGGHTVVYATDHESGDAERDAGLVTLARGADILIHDAQWTVAEQQRYQGFGHSSWRQAVDNGRAAGVKTLVLFHHHPHHDDAVLHDIADLATSHAGSDLEVLVARDGMLLEP